MTTLTDTAQDLHRLETTIERGARAFIEAGQALAEIRDRLLYREAGYESFERYCRERWQMSRPRAYELMGAAGVVEHLSAMADTPAPASERVSRELLPLRDEPEALKEAWGEAVEQHGPEPTAAQVRAIVRAPVPLPVGARQDTRFELIENAEAILRMLPAPERIAWPTEPGDLEAIDEALAWLSDWLPRAKASRKLHAQTMKAAAMANGARP